MLETTKDNNRFLYISILLGEWNQIEAAFEVCKCDLTDIYPFLSTCAGHCRGCCKVEGADGQPNAFWYTGV